MNLFSDQKLTAVVGAVVAVTAAAVYVAFGPSPEAPQLVKRPRNGAKNKKKVRGRPRGLTNSGNTCFVNAVLQAVAACPAVSLWLEESLVDRDPDAARLQSSLFTVLKAANGYDEDLLDEDEVGDPEVWAPARLFRTLRTYGWVINSGEQDAHEFFQVKINVRKSH